jgi:hypothetical protein
VLLKIRVFWDVTVCCWVISSSNGTSALGSSNLLGLFDPKQEGIASIYSVSDYFPSDTVKHFHPYCGFRWSFRAQQLALWMPTQEVE